MSNEKLVIKVLRPLPKRFAHKVTVIEEAQDLSIMRFDELIGSLTTFEMMFEATEPTKEKGVALQVSSLENGEENLNETVNMLAKKFNKTLKRFNKKPYSGGSTPGMFDQWTDKGWKNLKFGGSNSVGNTQSRSKGIQCRECEGEVERVSLLKKNEELIKSVEKQKLEIRILEDKIEGMIKGIKMMNSSTTILDEILMQGKRCGDNIGIGFNGGKIAKQTAPMARTFIAAGNQPNQNSKKRYNWRCYHCGKKGHIAPYYYKIYGKGRNKYTQPKMQWVSKEAVVSHVVFTSLKTIAWTGWYTRVEFPKQKSETFNVFKALTTQIQREKEVNILGIRSDHGREFENSKFQAFCDMEEIKHEYSTPITSQQNGIVERNNRTLQEMARVMIHAKHLPIKFWAEAVNTACHC
ncbi:hypothetical protein LIER_21858 [Lithospermum erythrorhizon]|uniref:Integrase catalytic domain-containing protein n=1 Tax=Lithospermum erythrorhizon TaxID=34254 RepID=A0AAV3QSZ1_LITER